MVGSLRAEEFLRDLRRLLGRWLSSTFLSSLGSCDFVSVWDLPTFLAIFAAVALLHLECGAEQGDVETQRNVHVASRICRDPFDAVLPSMPGSPAVEIGQMDS